MPAASPFRTLLSRLTGRSPVPTPGPLPSPGPVVGRPSWDLGGISSLLGPYSHVPIRENYQLFERLQEAVPVIDAAIVHITELVGCPCVEAEEETKADIDDWLMNRLRVNQVQTGWESWLGTWIGDMLTYGRSHAEIILNNTRDDVYALQELHPGTIGFTPAKDGYNLQTVQFGLQKPIVFPDWKVLSAINRIKTDDPNGTSLLWGLSIVGECFVAMVKSQHQLYTRFGTPTYLVNWKPPDGFNDPQGQISAGIMAGIKNQFDSAIANRGNGKISDVYTSGDVTVTVVGAAGEELTFSQSLQSVTEEIVTKTGLPPMIFGLPWSTTERMSTVQSSLLGEMVDRIQAALTPPLTRLILLRQQLKGGDIEFELEWESANLQDRLQEAQAEMQEQQAMTAKLANFNKLWSIGLLNTFDMAREFVQGMEEMDDEAIAAALTAANEKADSLLPDIQPAAAAPSPFGSGPDQAGPGQGGNPPFGQGPGNNRVPQASLSYDPSWRLLENGNGHG